MLSKVKEIDIDNMCVTQNRDRRTEPTTPIHSGSLAKGDLERSRDEYI